MQREALFDSCKNTPFLIQFYTPISVQEVAGDLTVCGDSFSHFEGWFSPIGTIFGPPRSPRREYCGITRTATLGDLFGLRDRADCRCFCDMDDQWGVTKGGEVWGACMGLGTYMGLGPVGSQDWAVRDGDGR